MTLPAALRLDPDVAVTRDELVALRRDFHMHPELALREIRTARCIAAYLERQQLEVRRIGETGVVATLDTGRPGRTIMVRADMDALPLAEQTALPFASTVDGVMHACGHDGHVAIVMTLARVMTGLRDRLRGRVKFVFQPAEEVLGGAEPMIAAGVLEAPAVDVVLVAHLQNDLPVGTVAVRPGPMLAGADRIELRVRGRAAHAAKPHLGVDAIVVAAHLVSGLQTVVSREVSPLESAAVSFGTIAGGVTWNLLAPEVTLAGTVRAVSASVRNRVTGAIERIAAHTAAALNATCDVSCTPLTAPTVNDPGVAAVVAAAAADAVGPAAVRDYGPIMATDDAAAFLERVPGAYFFVGSAGPDGEAVPSHNPRFTFDEDALLVGVQTFKNALLRLL